MAEGINSSINTLPEIIDTLIVPLGFKASNEGIYTLTANEFGDEVEVWLEDLYEDQRINLYNINYTFNTSVGEFNDRFRLLFSENEKIILNGGELPNEVPAVQIYSSKGFVYLKSDVANAIIGDVEIFNISGTLLKRINNTQEGLAEISLECSTGIYLVKLKTKYGSSSKRVLINNE